jgi:cytochrome c oxidase subunit 2
MGLQRVRPVILLAALVLGAAACSSDAAPVLTGEAARGQQIAKDKGCTSCHTPDGRRSEGPSWKGVAGSTVNLADGSSVVADDAYLARSITEPRAQVVKGFRGAMPVQSHSPDEVAALVAYIKALK